RFQAHGDDGAASGGVFLVGGHEKFPLASGDVNNVYTVSGREVFIFLPATFETGHAVSEARGHTAFGDAGGTCFPPVSRGGGTHSVQERRRALETVRVGTWSPHGALIA